MSSRMFEASVRSQDGIAVLDLRGEVNAFAEEVLNAAYTQAAAQSSQAVLFNFTQVNYINSTGIALIVVLLGRARKQQLRLLACGLSEHFVEIFTITRLTDFIQLFPDEAGALTHEMQHK